MGCAGRRAADSLLNSARAAFKLLRKLNRCLPGSRFAVNHQKGSVTTSEAIVIGVDADKSQAGGLSHDYCGCY